MSSRFNDLATQFEEVKPRVMTTDQLKTTYLHHLKSLLTPNARTSLSDEIRDVERSYERRGRDPLTRHAIHEMALRQEREEVSWQAKLRALGLVPRGANTDRHEGANIKDQSVE